MFSRPKYKDAFDINEELWDDANPLAICIGFNPWKRDYFREYFPDLNMVFIRGKMPTAKVLRTLKNIKEDYSVYIWSYKDANNIYKYLKKKNIPIQRIEDGFIRSIGLGSNKTKPLSLVIDNDSLYFNSQVESKLEQLIKKKSNVYSNEELERSKKLIDLITQHKISKYNFINDNSSELDELIDNDKKTILVIGQVEEDMSIKMGYDGEINNLELLKLAKQENNNSTILYKPHPDILTGNRKNLTSLEEYEGICTIVPQETNLHSLIKLSDHIYTITSLSGFEALLYKKKVTCLGSPFYAHWGLTDDRQTTPIPRKNIKLTLEELVFSALIDYPQYLYGSPEETIKNILSRKAMRPYSFKNNFSFYTLDANQEDAKSVLKKFKNKKIALITSNSNISQLYLGLNHDAFVDVYTSTLNIENIIRDKNIVNPEKNKFLVKAFMEPLSVLENDTIELAQKISNNYFNILKKITSSTFEQDESKVFSTIIADDLEDKIFNDCALYLSLEKIAIEYDYIVYNHNYTTPSPHLKLFKSPIFEDKVYIPISNSSNQANRIIKAIKSNTLPPILHNTTIITDNVVLSFRKTWDSAKYDYSLIEKERDKTLVLCANITDKNYAYYPSAQEIFKLAKEQNLNLRFIPAIYVNNARYNAYKQIMLEDTGLKINTEVFPSFIKDILDANKKLGHKINNKVSPKILQLLESKLLQELPDELYLLILPSVTKCIDEFAQHSAMYFRMKQYMQNSKIFVSTMERSVISRLATLAATNLDIETIGIQPQVISTSKRYRVPLVKKMLVIDPLQEENYMNLGYPKNQMTKIGSANLRKHLKLIETANKLENANNTKKNILFIMQHSMPNIMYKCIEALKEIDQSFHIFLKPHPFQEKPVLNAVQLKISTNNNITLLDKDAETYQYIKNSNIVTGLFSSAIYEAILASKDVVVLKLDQLDPSIDFSRFNTCMQVFNTDELKSAIDSFIVGDDQATKIRNTQKKYITNNSYIYSVDKLVKQIEQKEK